MLENFIIILSASAFLLFYFFIYHGLKKTIAGNRITSQRNESKISIVIAAKNEEKNIEELFERISGQKYPSENIELIFIDDGSNDNTFSTAENFSERLRHKKILRAEKKKWPAKKGALQFGIEKATYNNILITDADCLPEKNWASSLAAKLNDGNDLVFGASPMLAVNNFKLPLFENLRTSLLTFAAAGLGRPYSAASRSFGFTADVFAKINGYENIQETLGGDDDLLIREAVKNKLKVAAVLHEDSFVFSRAESNLRDYMNQKSRHVKTSLHYLPEHKAFLTGWHLINISFILSPLLIFFSVKIISLFLLKIFADLFIIKKIQKKFGYNFSAGEIIFHQFLYEIFLIINFFNALFRKDKWK